MTIVVPQSDASGNECVAMRAEGVAKKAHRSLGQRLVSGAILLVGLRIVSAGTMLLSQLFLARWLGAHQFGEYILAITWFQTLTLIAKAGWESASSRFVAEYAAKDQWPLLLGYRIVRDSAVLGFGLAIAALSAIVLGAIGDSFSPTQAQSLWLALALMPLAALADVAAADLRARQRIAWADGPLQIIRHLLTLAIAAFVMLTCAHLMDATLAMGIYVTCSLIVIAAVVWRSRREIAAMLPTNSLPCFETRLWWRTMLPMFWVAGCGLILLQGDVILVGLLVDAREAGIYSAAARLTTVIALGLGAVNAVGAPLVAEQFALANRAGLQRAAQLMAWGSFLLTVPCAIALVILGPWLLGLFGSEFTAGYSALVVLMVGQLVNGLCGSVGQLLTMTDRQHSSARVLSAFAVLHIALSLILIPYWGIFGAALATCLARIGWNIVMVFIVTQDLGINPTVFGSFALAAEVDAGGLT